MSKEKADWQRDEAVKVEESVFRTVLVKPPPIKTRRKSHKSQFLSDRHIQIALECTDGKVIPAAKMLHCAPGTLRRRVNESEELQAVEHWARESLFDLSESVLKGHLRMGSLDAAKYVAERLGKSKGYQRADSQVNVQVNISHEEALAALEGGEDE